MKDGVKNKTKYTPEEREEYVKAYRTARQSKKGTPKGAERRGKEAVATYRTRIGNLKAYVDDDKDISVLEE